MVELERQMTTKSRLEKDQPISNTVPSDLQFVKTFVYDKCNFEFSELQSEDESTGYGAHTFKINGMTIKYRMAKITPTKTGQFVTVWKRNKNGSIEPFDISDDLDLVIISTRKEDQFGQFIFPKATLVNKGILSGNNKDGKRGFRVYPPWNQTVNTQAKKTQQWQLDYFLKIPNEYDIDLTLAKKLIANTGINDFII